MDRERLLESERERMEQIRELDMEELQVEEVSDEDIDASSSDSDGDLDTTLRNGGNAGLDGGFTFDTCLASLHTYLGEIDDTHGRLAFLDGDAVLNLPMFYIEGVVLFPEATLPLRVVQPRFIAAVERALRQVDAPCTIGVVRAHRHAGDGRILFSKTGTTAEIRQHRQLDDGSLNVVARGQQRFRLRRQWTDVDEVPWAQVQIIQEDTPLRTPKNAFGQLASVGNSSKFSRKFSSSSAVPSGLSENHSECMLITSSGKNQSDIGRKMGHLACDSTGLYERTDESCSSDEEFVLGQKQRLQKASSSRSGGSGEQCHEGIRQGGRLGSDSLESSPGERSIDYEIRKGGSFLSYSRCMYGAPMTFWPLWIYQMHDAYALARRATDLWRQIIGSPRLDDYAKKPDVLSFYIASKLPISESKRQELLEIDGISYRLQREIQFLKSFNLIRCKTCLTSIAKRSDMLVMSSDGPLNAYVNPHGYVHEVLTVYNASGLATEGYPDKKYSWFPGYAWTITNCATCGALMGWLFTATKKNLLPRSFFGIRSCQVADDTSDNTSDVEGEDI